MTTPTSILHFCEFDTFYETPDPGRKAVSPDFDILDFTDSAHVRLASDCFPNEFLAC